MKDMQEAARSTERYLTMRELMDMLHISRSTVYRLMASGLPSVKIGTVHRFPHDEILAWLKKVNGNSNQREG